MDIVANSDILFNILALIPIGVFWKDKDRKFLGANQMFLDYYGFTSVEDILGKTDEDMGWHIDPEPYRSIELRVINNGEIVKDVPGQCIVKGRVRDIRASKCPLKVNDTIIGLVGYFVDITEELAEKGRLSVLSMTDELTGVFNRRAYSEIVEKYAKQYEKDNTDFALYMIDLDDFKNVNDNYGHEFGNLVLKSLCKSLTTVAADNCVLFRYGGDEFVILHQIKDADEAVVMQKRIQKAIDAPRNIDGIHLSTKASIGCALYSETLYLTALIERADQNMYKMKKEHKASR
ncbi:sensor domain-containing diguanylate cyclase [Butyrivibrio sp. YAB3001]|uniref:sensor domain-containing diguanylate cyclase n=1 Tax=Butyrivibrio sp. YAB3001 TaxID=1520812 RepID=UPI0008F63062|nr:sensor domain-containing diguanylate cyclase [Butyrivibrio sp. YAB3001]SFC88234.1 diguanylate cyclase (GGDEF) domain-containing protein [Butyrivibrio sp. YAB3001]